MTLSSSSGSLDAGESTTVTVTAATFVDLVVTVAGHHVTFSVA
jgi:hypothetical protein